MYAHDFIYNAGVEYRNIHWDMQAAAAVCLPAQAAGDLL
jgi:hypothetical protein